LAESGLDNFQHAYLEADCLSHCQHCTALPRASGVARRCRYGTWLGTRDGGRWGDIRSRFTKNRKCYLWATYDKWNLWQT